MWVEVLRGSRTQKGRRTEIFPSCVEIHGRRQPEKEWVPFDSYKPSGLDPGGLWETMSH